MLKVTKNISPRGILITMILALLTSVSAQQQGSGPLRVFILVGQSNMEGHGVITPNSGQLDHSGGMGTLDYLVENDADDTYQHLVENNGDWVVRDDVWIYYLRGGTEEVKGGLTAGMGANAEKIGPELQFGHVMGDFYEDQVLLIKTAWGGKSLAVDFRPPSAGGDVGPYYTEVVDIVTSVLTDLGSHFTGYNGDGYEIMGLGWHQGWNDGGDMDMINEYESNMTHFIKDIRDELQVENMPFVIASSGLGGFEDRPYGGTWIWNIQDYLNPAQLAVGDPAKHPEFEGNVTAVNTQAFWRNDSISPARSVHHWNINAESYFLIGNSLAEAMVELLPEDEITGCTDTLYVEYDSTATVHDSSACQTLGVRSSESGVGLQITVSRSSIKVTFSSSSPNRIAVFNTVGKIIYQNHRTGLNTSLITGMKPGIYVILVSSGGETLRKKVLIP